MFADDIKILGEVNDSISDPIVQQAFDKIVTWAVANGLSLSSDKTQVMRIGSHSISPVYAAADHVLKTVSEVRDLGFYYDYRLNFKKHCNILVSKGNRRSFNLFKALRSKNQDVLLRAYKLYVRPILEYGSSVFNPYAKNDIRALESVQNSFTRKLMLRCSSLRYVYIPNGSARGCQHWV
ncbi:unnamed protein product [Haemonchus placei]|uniref:Reverse transcriptase domain-containing protein n=1 Tax=Haemonchus placei TaxID=6290 RepID=A0A0N4W3S0_HAEPC|nr:unnamed protein product [Haemonchus placei]